VTATSIALVLTFGGCSSSKSPAGGTGPGAAQLNKALTEIINGQLPQAATDLQSVIKIDPQNKYAFYNLGYIYQTEQKRADAEAQYRLALAIDPKYEPALYNLAILRTADGDVTGAIQLYRQAIASNANDASAHFNLGLLLRQTGKTKDGNAEVRAAVKIQPSLAGAAKAQGVPGS
jgi:Tfp pilus assembly protein PilF